MIVDEDFDFTIYPLLDGAIEIGEEESDYFDDIIAIGLRNKSPRLIKAAYESFDEIVAEARKNFGKFLPDNFPYTDRLVWFFGTPVTCHSCIPDTYKLGLLSTMLMSSTY